MSAAKLILMASARLNIDYLVQAGGAAAGGVVAGSSGSSGGGGAGQLKTGSLRLPIGYSAAISVGPGGLGVANDDGLNGGNSAIGSLVLALGGGGGGATLDNGKSGGNGGGGGNGGAAGGTGTDHNGGAGDPGTLAGGGGGGTSADGGPGSGSGIGGAGTASSISGASVTYGVGGSVRPIADTTALGSGGNGLRGFVLGPPGADVPGLSGIIGIVIIRYLGAQRATGGTITTSGGYTIHTFTTSGTFTVTG